MEIHTLEEADIQKGSRVILRADFDVTMIGGSIDDDFRIRQTCKTINYIISRGGFLRIISHIGRPGGKPDESLSLKNILPIVERECGTALYWIANPFDARAKEQHLNAAQHLFFENIRFWDGEEKNDAVFAKELAEWGNIYVDEAFAVSHRNHASVVALPALLPHFSGFHFAEEIAALSRVLDNPPRPLAAILAGEKIETKLALVKNFLEKGDMVLVGGTLMNTLLFCRGMPVGKSAVDQGFIADPDQFVLNHPLLLLPVDSIVAKNSKDKGSVKAIADISADEIIFDIGPESARMFDEAIQKAKTVVWNGPLGRAEIEQFSHGTIAVAKSIQNVKGLTVVGGGHTIAALRHYGLFEGFSHISTGGGAMLEFLAGKPLPGVEILKK